MDVAAGAVFIVVIGFLVKAATRAKKAVPRSAPEPVALLGVVPPPRSEMIIDSQLVEP